jgi:hypothetical protein
MDVAITAEYSMTPFWQKHQELIKQNRNFTVMNVTDKYKGAGEKSPVSLSNYFKEMLL